MEIRLQVLKTCLTFVKIFLLSWYSIRELHRPLKICKIYYEIVKAKWVYNVTKMIIMTAQKSLEGAGNCISVPNNINERFKKKVSIKNIYHIMIFNIWHIFWSNVHVFSVEWKCRVRSITLGRSVLLFHTLLCLNFMSG